MERNIKMAKKQKIDAATLAMHASAVIQNPAYIEAVDAIRQNYIDQMVATLPAEQAHRDHLHRCIHALDDVGRALTIFISTGKMEKMMADKVEKQRKAQ